MARTNTASHPFHTTESVVAAIDARKKLIITPLIWLMATITFITATSFADFIWTSKEPPYIIGAILIGGALAIWTFVYTALASHSYFFKFDKVVASLLKSSEGRELLKRGSDLVCLKEKRTLLMQTLKITEDQCGSQKDWDQSSDFMSSEFERPHGLPTLTSYPFIANDLAELRAYANAQVGDIAVIQQRLHEDQSRFLVHLYEMTRRENPWTPTEVTPPLSTDALKAALSPH